MLHVVLTVSIPQIDLATFRRDAEPLLADHWREVAKHRDLMVLAPDWAKYEEIEAAGGSIIFGAYVGDRMVGYSIAFAGTHLHYAGLVSCSNDVLYVAPEYRKGRLGLQLIYETERAAAERGAKIITWHAKEGTALAKLLPRIGYGVHEVIYSKRL